ncbi:MAG TPA: hypothetical protein PLU47_00865 [Azonexus sp.]|nr:hypothetical protein [Azonexus sp.]
MIPSISKPSPISAKTRLFGFWPLAGTKAWVLVKKTRYGAGNDFCRKAVGANPYTPKGG